MAEYQMSNSDKVYLTTCAILFVGVLFMANNKLKTY
jgi:hypothetical protein